MCRVIIYQVCGIFLLLLLIIKKVTILKLQGFYIVTYALGIYYLNMLIAFLTPKIDPAIYDFEGNLSYCCCLMNETDSIHVFFLIWSIDEGPSLPTSANEEFRPFIRRLPEFKFWYLVFFLVDYNLWNFNIFLYHTQVFIDNSNINFIDLYVLWILQHTSILAYIVALFYHIVLHNNETTNQSMDKKVFLSTIF